MLLLEAIGLNGGTYQESELTAKTGQSHGTFLRARRELLDGGLIEIEKDGRAVAYTVTDDGRIYLPDPVTEFKFYASQDAFENAMIAKYGDCDITAPVAGKLWTVFQHGTNKTFLYSAGKKAGGFEARYLG